MALSMDEQRMLAEIERRLAAEDPGLAARLSSFKRPSPAARLRTSRGRVIGSLFAVALALAISIVVYAMVPFRAHSPRNIIQQATGGVSHSAPAKVPPAKAGKPAKTGVSAGKAAKPSTVAGSSVTANRP
jgi:hypothetical protein